MSGKIAPDADKDHACAALFARVAAMSSPAVPPGMTERIVRDVPRLAQMPAPYAPLRVRVLRAAAAPVPASASAHRRRAPAGRRPVAGWAAVAAGIAAIALMLPSAFPAQRPAHGTTAPAPRQIAQIRIEPTSAVHTVAVPVSTVKLAANHRARAHGPVWPPATPDSGAVIPAVVAEPASGQLAVAVASPLAGPAPVASSRPVYGPVDTEAQSPGMHSGTHSGIQGEIGTGQGFAWTSHDTGAQPH